MILVNGWMGVNIYCMLQLIFILFREKRKCEQKTLPEKAYIKTVLITLFCLLADLLSRLDTGSVWLYPAVVLGAVLKYCCIPLCVPFYFNYIRFQIHESGNASDKRWCGIIWLLVSINAVLALTTLFTRQVFYFDADHVYHRGPLYPVSMMIMMITALLVELYILHEKEEISRRYYHTLLLFQLPPLLGGLIQTFFYGLPFSLMGVCFSILVVYINILNRSMDTDYLTGAYNRNKLDHMLHQIVLHSKHRKESFAMMMIDLDSFKEINDTYGHSAGDTALEHAVNILSSSIRRNDFIGRFGGDEFCVVLEHCDDTILRQMTERIHSALQSFNAAGTVPYTLSFSIGSAVYHPEENQTLAEFLQEIDRRMYEEKKLHHAAIRNCFPTLTNNSDN